MSHWCPVYVELEQASINTAELTRQLCVDSLLSTIPLVNQEISWSQQHPTELVQAGRKDVSTAFTTICKKIWQPGECPTPGTQSLVIRLRKKGNPQQCQNNQTISLISRPSHAEDHTEQIEATSGKDRH